MNFSSSKRFLPAISSLFLLSILLPQDISARNTAAVPSSPVGHQIPDSKTDNSRVAREMPKPSEVIWKSLRDGEIHHSTAKVENRNFHISRVIVESPPEKVWSVLTDYENASTTIPHLKELKILSQNRDDKKIWFKVASLGGLWKFDYTLNVHETRNKRIDWQRDSGAFKVNDGSWQLESLEHGNKTLVTYAKHIDAGFLIPKAFVDGQLKKTMPEVLDNLRAAVDKNGSHIASGGIKRLQKAD